MRTVWCLAKEWGKARQTKAAGKAGRLRRRRRGDLEGFAADAETQTGNDRRPPLPLRAACDRSLLHSAPLCFSPVSTAASSKSQLQAPEAKNTVILIPCRTHRDQLGSKLLFSGKTAHPMVTGLEGVNNSKDRVGSIEPEKMRGSTNSKNSGLIWWATNLRNEYIFQGTF